MGIPVDMWLGYGMLSLRINLESKHTFSIGKSKGGLMDISLFAEQVAGWVLSHHMCDTLPLTMDEMFVN